MLTELKLANDLFPALLDDSKRVTCRLGRRDVPLGHFVFVSTDPVEEFSEDFDYFQAEGKTFLYHRVAVTEVKYKRLVTVTDEEAQNDGFDDLVSMVEGLRRFYPDVQMMSEVTLIYFQTKRY